MTPTDSTVPSQATLLLVDVQKVFLRVIARSQRLLSRCIFAAEASHLLGIPVLFTEQLPEKLGGIHPDLAKYSTDVLRFPKSCFSALGSVDLCAALSKSASRHLLVDGLETPICIYQTAVQALREDFEVTLLTDCIGARRKEDAAAVLNYLGRQENCHLLPSETVFYSLLGGADHRQFRRFTTLVKKHNSMQG